MWSILETRGDGRSRRTWALAESQHGVVTRRQLRALGFSARAIEHRLARGRLHLIMHGVYAVGRPEISQEGRWLAAVLACGDGAMLGHRSAAALWEIVAERRAVIEISVRRSCNLERPGLRVRSRPRIRPEDVTTRRGIPVTAPVRTLVDIATELEPIAIERAVNEADKRALVDPETLRDAIDRYAGQPGAPALRRILDKHTFRLSDSDLEILFRPISAEAGLSTPLTKQIVNGWEVDFYWPDLGLVIETDGLRYHRTPSTQARDAQRDRAHLLAGMTPLRFTHYEIKHEPVVVVRQLAAAAALLREGNEDRPRSGVVDPRNAPTEGTT